MQEIALLVKHLGKHVIVRQERSFHQNDVIWMFLDRVLHVGETRDVGHHLEGEGVLLWVFVEELEHPSVILVGDRIPLAYRFIHVDDFTRASHLEMRLQMLKQGGLARADVAFNRDKNGSHVAEIEREKDRSIFIKYINIQIHIMKMANSFISVSSLTKEDVLFYIVKATQMKDGPLRKFPHKTLINMFYEPSTRTSCSFQAAAIKLGCNVINLTDKVSSVEKGESLEDTIQTLNAYGDVIVLRHPLKGSSEKAARVSRIPIINAGDGNGEHPTQALLDIYTIYSELASFGIDLDSDKRDTLVVTFLGDLKNSRTVHSLIHLLLLFPKIKCIYISPPSLEMAGCPYEMDLQEAIPITDILYVTRIQKERFEKEEYITPYVVNKELIAHAKEKMIIMHPLPRMNELSTELDSDPRAVYFKQVENGVYMRMAILDTLYV